MAVSMYARAIARKRTPAVQRRWSRDLRAPALRLTPPAQPEPERTVPLPIVAPRIQPDGIGEKRVPQTNRQLITLREIKPRETMPFMGRVTACPYLECRSSNRRCLSADPAPISLERQVRHCFSEDHRRCRYYRKARGLPKVPPNQAAFYTAAAVLLLVIVALTSL